MKQLYASLVIFLLLAFSDGLHAQITGDSSVCSGESVIFSAVTIPGASYSWYVSGGNVIGSSLADSAVIQWGAAGSGIVTLIVISPNNPPASFTFNVVIHPRPAPKISHQPYPGCPSGGGEQGGTSPDHEGKGNCEKVCKYATITYSTPLAAGSSYVWAASGFLQITGQYTNTLTVQWDSTAFGSLTVYETNVWGCIDSNKICVEKVDLPVAKFTHPLNVCKDSQVQFTNQSIGAVSYQWYFGDGGSSTQVNPLHIYTAGGTYVITLIATNACHCSDTIQSTITVDALPGPDITCPSTVCAYDSATYSTSVSGCTYNWFVQGGSIVGPANLQSVTVAWGPGQMGAIGLLVSGCAGLCTDTTWVYIPIIPAIVSIAGPSKVCPGECVTYSIPKFSGATYTWSLNSGSCGTIKDTSCCGTVEICYPAFGAPCNDTLTVSYYDAFLGCGGTGTKIIRFRPELQIFGQKEVCVKSVGNFYASSGVLCNWSISPPGPILSPNPASSLQVNWMNMTGTYTVTAVPQFPNQVCNDSVLFQVTVIPSPAAPVITGDTLLCPNSTAQYCATASGNISWSIIGGTPASGAGNCITVTWGNTPPFVVQAVNSMNTLPYCSSDTTTLNVSVFAAAPIPQITGNHVACANQSGSYLSSVALPAGSTYNWSLSPANAGSIINGPNANPIQIEWGNNAPQTVVLSLTISVCGFTATDTFHIQLSPVPLPVAFQAGTLCQGGTAQLGVTGGVFTSYQWSGPGGFSSMLASPTITLEGLYQVTVSNGGCSAISQITVKYVGNPLASISAQGPLAYCIGSGWSVNLCALGNPNYSYQWSNAGPAAQCYNVSTPGTYWVTVTDITSGCYAVSNMLTVTEDSCTGTGGPGCTPNGSVSFTPSSCNPKVFTNTSVNASSFTWNFGDLNYSNAVSPTHLYNQAGFYLVFLSGYVPDAAGLDSCLLVDTALIEIPLVAKFEFSQGCFGQPVCFTDKSVFTAGNNITSWNWNFGDANTSSLQNPCHTYASPGTYFVTLTIANANCTTSVTDTVIIGPKPIAAFSFGNNACLNTSVLFTDNSVGNNNSWNWNFGNGGTSLNQNPSQTYTVAGPYPVTLIVKDINGCADTVTQIITVNAPLVSGNITAFPDTIVCAGTSVLLVAPACGSCTYAWSNGSVNDSITVTQTGVYAVVITDANGCKYTTWQKIIVQNGPQTVISGSTKKMCVGSYATLSVQYSPNWIYNWFSNDTMVNGNPYSGVGVYPATPGTYSYYVIITDTTTGCSDTTLPYVLNVYMPPVSPVITAVGPSTVCKGDTITLVVTHPDPSVTFQWNTGEINDTIRVTKSGCFKVIAADTNGCEAMDIYCVTVNPLPEVCSFYEGCFDTCAPYLIQGPIGATSYQWYLNGNLLPGDTLPTYLAAIGGTYSVAVTNSFGCSDTTGNLQLSLYDCPNDSLCADFIVDTVFCNPVTGLYVMQYHVINYSGSPVSAVSLQILPPNLGIAYSPNLVLQTILPGDTSTLITATIFNGVAGDVLCFRTSIGGQDSTGCCTMCCPSDTICIILPPCPGDSVCCEFNFVSDSIWCVPSETGSKIYKFNFVVDGCGTLNIGSLGAGTINLVNPYILTGSPITISGTYIPASPQDTVLCLVFTMGNGETYCADTTICFHLPGCPPPPPPCHWEYPKVICQGNTAVFQYFIFMPATTYTWTFPGGIPASATGMGPHSVVYPVAGTYPVQLSISNAYGSTSCVDSIKVVPPPVANITVSGNTLFALPGGMNYQWYNAPVNPGNIIPGETNQFYTPSITGNYCVVVSNNYHCMDTACIFIEIQDSTCCHFDFLADSIVCSYTEEGIKVYNFTFQVDGCGTLNIGSLGFGTITLSNPYILTGSPITISGTYIPASPQDTVLCLVFTMGNGQIYCADTTICFHLPGCPPPPPPCHWEFPKVICQGNSAVFQYFVYIPATTYTWTFPGGIPASATGMGPHTIVYPVAGTYPVQLTISNAYGSATCVDSIKVVPPPVANITVSGNTLYALPSGMNYQWYFAPAGPGNIIPGETNQFFTPSITGNYCVVVSNDYHCLDTACYFIEVPDSTCCYLDFCCDSLACSYTEEGIKVYHFKFQVFGCGTLTVTTPNTGALSFSNPYVMTGGMTYITGSYISQTDTVLCLHFSLTNGFITCVDTTICYALPDCPPPVLPCDWTVSPDICEGSVATYVYNGFQPGVTYLWMFPGGIPANATGVGPHSVLYPTSGTYSVILTMTNAQGYTICDDVITVNPKPVAEIVQSGNALLAQPDGLMYQWYSGIPSPNTLIPEAVSQYYVPPHTGTYCLIVYDEVGCADTICTVFAILDVYSNAEGNANITVSPNPTNGELSIQFNGDHHDISIDITNLTGQLVARHRAENAALLKMTIDGPAGLYYVIARNGAGEQAVFKIIKR